MAEYTDVIKQLNAVHKDKGGTYGEDTAVQIVQIGAEYYEQNTQDVLEATPAQLYETFDRIYTP